jgi:maltodextrin utilization protein YvdJ
MRHENEIKKIQADMREQHSLNEKMMNEMKADFERKEKEFKNKINQQSEEIEKLQKNKREFEVQYNDMKSLKDDLQKNLEKTIMEIENMKRIHQDELRSLMMRKTQEQVFSNLIKN